MMLIKYQNYYIATDANHVTQHRRIVTPWFYVRLKSVKYAKVKDVTYFIMGLMYRYSGWTSTRNKPLDPQTKQKLEAVTLPFSFDESVGK